MARLLCVVTYRSFFILGLPSLSQPRVLLCSLAPEIIIICYRHRLWLFFSPYRARAQAPSKSKINKDARREVLRMF